MFWLCIEFSGRDVLLRCRLAARTDVRKSVQAALQRKKKHRCVVKEKAGESGLLKHPGTGFGPLFLKEVL